MSKLDDLNAAIDNESADITSIQSNVSAVLDELKAAQAAGTGITDDQVTALIAKISTADESLKTIDQNLKDAEPAPPPATPPAA